MPQLAGTFLHLDAGSSRQYVGRIVTDAGQQTISFIAPPAETTQELLLLRETTGPTWTPLPFAITTLGVPGFLQVLAAPGLKSQSIATAASANGRPIEDFAKTLPYASEIFGVYQPLAGWFGQNNIQRIDRAGAVRADTGRALAAFTGAAARTLSTPQLAALANQVRGPSQAILSPVGPRR